MTGPPRTVSLGGADNVGKTTALEWLAIAAPGSQLVGSIDRWHPGWAAVAGKTFANWWFAESTTAEHVELVLASHQARRVASGTLAWEDRGEPMLLATCAATCVVKDGLAADDALDVVTTLARPHAAEPREELHILLRHTDRGPESEAALALARDPYPPGTWYAAYQRALAEILDLQTANGDYDAVLVRGDSSVLDVQRQLRAVLAEHGVPVRPLPASAPERVWALGGMSESGKSTAGELLAAEHGATRLKIGWLLQTAALRAGVTDPYDAWNERAQAAHLAEEILHRRTEYLPPYPSGAADDRAARGELGLVLMTSRRLLAAALPDIRALHKHLVLIAKILLRAGGTDLDDADDVLTVFAQHHPAITGNSWMPAGPRPGAGALAVDVVAALAAAENPDPAAVDQLLAAVAAVVRLTDTLPATVLRRNP
jgi:hypothetical protein